MSHTKLRKGTVESWDQWSVGRGWSFWDGSSPGYSSGRTRKDWVRILNEQHAYFSALKWPDFYALMTLTGRDLLPNLNSVLELRSRPQFSGPKPEKKKLFEFPVSQYFKLLKFKEADLTSSIWVHFDYLNNINAKNENIRKSFFDIRQFPTPEWSYFDALGRIIRNFWLSRKILKFSLLIII